MRRGIALLLVAAAAALCAGPVQAYIDHTQVSHAGGPDAIGCSCHRVTAEGPAQAPYSPEVVPTLDGVPPEYRANQTYTLRVSVRGPASPTQSPSLLTPNPPPPPPRRYGFALRTTDGSLLLPEPGTSYARDDEGHRAAGHDRAGSTRTSWTVTWRAPLTPGEEDVAFFLAVSWTDGNGEKTGDRWNGLNRTAEAPPNTAEVGGANTPSPFALPLVWAVLALLAHRRSRRPASCAANNWFLLNR